MKIAIEKCNSSGRVDKNQNKTQRRLKKSNAILTEDVVIAHTKIS